MGMTSARISIADQAENGETFKKWVGDMERCYCGETCLYTTVTRRRRSRREAGCCCCSLKCGGREMTKPTLPLLPSGPQLLASEDAPLCRHSSPFYQAAAPTLIPDAVLCSVVRSFDQAQLPEHTVRMADVDQSQSQNQNRIRQTALYHAHLIQHQKDIQASIDTNIDKLTDFPLAPSTSSAAPDTADVKQFRELIPPFQPSDFDTLVEARNAEAKCGYVFCTKRVEQGSIYAKPHIDWRASKTGPLKFVDPLRPEIWCSKVCERRASFIRMQLSGVPAWEREDRRTSVEVLNEAEEDALQSKMRSLKLDADDSDDVRKAMEALAIERGETKSTSARTESVMSKDVLEN